MQSSLTLLLKYLTGYGRMAVTNTRNAELSDRSRVDGATNTNAQIDAKPFEFAEVVYGS